jgi:hypothetical protein
MRVAGGRHQASIDVAHRDVAEVDGLLQSRAKDANEHGGRRHRVEA